MNITSVAALDRDTLAGQGDLKEVLATANIEQAKQDVANNGTTTNLLFGCGGCGGCDDCGGGGGGGGCGGCGGCDDCGGCGGCGGCDDCCGCDRDCCSDGRHIHYEEHYVGPAAGAHRAGPRHGRLRSHGHGPAHGFGRPMGRRPYAKV